MSVTAASANCQSSAHWETEGDNRRGQGRESERAQQQGYREKKREGEGRLKDRLRERERGRLERRGDLRQKRVQREETESLASGGSRCPYWVRVTEGTCTGTAPVSYQEIIFTHAHGDVHILGQSFLAEEMLWFSCGEVFSYRGVAQNNEPMKSCTMWFIQEVFLDILIQKQIQISWNQKIVMTF